MKYRILIVDDEPLARERLKRMLQEHGDFECVGETGDGDAALRWLRQFPTDVILLDIQMPGRSGLEVARDIVKLDEPPAIVFCTAYDDHAVEAFRLNAVDYLMKPVRSADLTEALKRAIERKNAGATLNVDSLTVARTHLSARTHTGLQLIPVETVAYFNADQKYVCVCHDQGDTLIDDSLKQLEDEFGHQVVRIHRATLVMKSRITRLEVTDSGQLLYLRGVEKGLAVSRRHLPGLRKIMRQL